MTALQSNGYTQSMQQAQNHLTVHIASANEGGGDSTNYRHTVVPNGAPTMLHIFLCFSVVSDVIRWHSVDSTALAAKLCERAWLYSREKKKTHANKPAIWRYTENERVRVKTSCKLVRVVNAKRRKTGAYDSHWELNDALADHRQPL
jgi:hypothetical protein